MDRRPLPSARPDPDLPCPGMARVSGEGEEEVERVQHEQLPSFSLNEIKHDIENITQKIEVLDPFHKQAAINVLQECTERLQLQLGSDEIPQLDGNSDMVIFCEFCNTEFMGDKRSRDRQSHYINVHLKSKFEEITPMKSENYFKCNKSECEFKTTRKLDFWRHMGGKHGLLQILVKEHFDQNPPLIPANGHIEDKETEHISPREEQGPLHADTSTSSLGRESGSYDNIPAPSFNTNTSYCDHEMISFHQPPGQEDLRSMSPTLSATGCQEPDMEAKRREEEEEAAAAVASILADNIEEAEKIDHTDVIAPGMMENEGGGGGTKTHIKFKLPNNASYLVPRDCGQTLDQIISILLKRRSQKLSSFEAFASGNEPLDLSQDCSTLDCSEVLVQPRVLFRLELLDKATLEVMARDTEVIEEVLSNIVFSHGLTLSDLQVSVSRYGNLESVDLTERVTSIDNTRVIIRNMPGAADETQELVHEDECPEPPPRTSTPVPGHHEGFSGPFLNTTDILMREHSYSRAGSVTLSEHQNLRSVSGYHSLSVSVSEMEGAETDQRQTPTTSPGVSSYTASVSESGPTNQSQSGPQIDRANQMPGSLGGGDSGISSRASTVTGAASPRDTVIHHDHDKLDGPCEKIPDDDEEGGPVTSIHEVVIPGPVTSMADFVFTSVSPAHDGKFNNHKFHIHQCQAQIEI